MSRRTPRRGCKRCLRQCRQSSAWTDLHALPGRPNEHWFTSLAHARVVIEEWRRDYNEQRSKKNLGGMPPAVYAARLSSRGNSDAKESSTVCAKDSKSDCC
ncbi:transposase [Nitrospirales bacterium NOB]|nr:transposase [Nitrospirales bacterium NOB]